VKLAVVKGSNHETKVDLVPGYQTGDDELHSSIEYIGREAEALQKIAAENGFDFLSYILKIAVLEAEIILGKREPSVEESHNDVDKCAKFIC